MKNISRKVLFGTLFCLGMIWVPNLTSAEEDTAAMKARIEALEKELAEVKALLKEQIQQSATKEEVQAVKKDVVEKVQAVKKDVEVAKTEQAEWKTYDSTVHLAGYGAVGYTNDDPMNDRFNQVQFNPIFHYLFKDLILLESELELAIEDDGATEIVLEYLTIDWFMNDYMALVGGKFLSPLGQFRQNLHPAWINKLPSAPSGFGHDQAAPVADVGLQLRGGFPIGNPMYANYALFVTNGPELELNMAGDEIEAVETAGVVSNEDENFLFGGRIGFLPIPSLEIGASAAFGDVALEDESDRDYEAWGFDTHWWWRNLDIFGEYIQQEVGSLASSVAPDEQEWEAWYVQASYKLLPTKFEVVARYSDYDSTHADQEQEQWALGLNYLFAPNAIAKFAYEFNDGLDGEPTDDDRLFIQLTYGF
ncbi:MAG: porin [Gammaproteobacteria bacterium]|nr:porin [Gammaproteobacteria bacterium]